MKHRNLLDSNLSQSRKDFEKIKSTEVGLRIDS